MKVTDLAIVNPLYRNYRKAQTLLASIERRADYHNKQGQYDERAQHRRTDVEIDLKTYISQLDNNELKTPTPKWVAWKTEDVMQYIFRQPAPGKAHHNQFEQTIIDFMNEKGQRQRAGTQSFWLQCALAKAHQDGWALLFNTLTVSPEHYTEVFRHGSRAFDLYLRAIDRAAARNEGQPRDAKGYHKYFAVIEEGARTGRLHIHVLHMTSLPLSDQDPNRGKSHPTNREIHSLKKLWKYGWSKPIAIRYSLADAYSRRGWRWPLDPKTMKGIPTKQVGAIGGYMTKYILKSYTSQSRSEYLWRIRKTQNLGREILDQLVSKLTIKTLSTIASLETIKCRMNRQTVPPQALRLACLRRLQDLQSTESQFVSGKDLQPLPSLLLAARASIRENGGFNPPSSGPSMIQTITAEDASSAQAELDQAAFYMDAAYFRYSVHESTTLSTRHVAN